jgi:hypothetical protein
MGDHLGSHCMIPLTARMKPMRVLCLQRSQTMMYTMGSVKILDGSEGYWVQYMIDLALLVFGFIRIVQFGVLRYVPAVHFNSSCVILMSMLSNIFFLLRTIAVP